MNVVVFVLEHVGSALRLSFAMFWQVLWPLALGFLLSAVVETLVSKKAVSRLLGRDTPKSIALATVFGAASSSCSYAAVAVARTLFRKGSTLGNAVIFEFARPTWSSSSAWSSSSSSAGNSSPPSSPAAS